MTKDAVKKVLESEYAQYKVLCIQTNIAHGKGINWVDFSHYRVGLYEEKKNDYYCPTFVERSTAIKIIDFDDDFIVLEVQAKYYNYMNSRVNLKESSTNILYLPLNSVVSFCYATPYDNTYSRLTQLR